MYKKLFSVILMVIVFINFGLVFNEAIAKTDNTFFTESKMSDELLMKENTANMKYNAILRHWAIEADFVDDFNANFPDFYGGIYIDDYKNLVIQVTTQDEDVLNYFSNIIDLEDVLFEQVKFSFKELKAEYNSILNMVKLDQKNKILSDINGVAISNSDNSINIYINSNEKMNRDSVDTMKKELFSFPNINIKYSGEFSNGAGVSPGDKLNNRNFSRSVGFWAYDSFGNLGIITAPHDSLLEGEECEIDSQLFGIAQRPYYEGNVDAVFIKRTNTAFTPTRTVPYWMFSLDSSTTIYLAEGSSVYARGEKNGCQTGETIDTFYTTTYGISNCVLTNVTSGLGDSGGIYAGGGDRLKKYIAGINTGFQRDTNYGIYVKAGSILSKLNCKLY